MMDERIRPDGRVASKGLSPIVYRDQRDWTVACSPASVCTFDSVYDLIYMFYFPPFQPSVSCLLECLVYCPLAGASGSDLPSSAISTSADSSINFSNFSFQPPTMFKQRRV